MNIYPMPRVIALSAIAKDFITQKVLGLGADYYVKKPFNTENFVKRISQMFNNTLSSDEIKIADAPSNLEMYVTDIIHQLGAPAHIQGYMFLREAIIMVVNNTELISTFTKELYLSIALKFNTTANSVERSIRNAINIAYRGAILWLE
jgi:two-component system response regulator (stage 0 sporulation protein A)